MVIFLNGCASSAVIFNSTDPNINFSSNVDAAVFYGEDYCFTPCELEAIRAVNITFTVVAQGKQFDIVVNAKEFNIFQSGSNNIGNAVLGAFIDKSIESLTCKPVDVMLTYSNIFLYYENGKLTLYSDEVKNESIDGKVYEIQ